MREVHLICNAHLDLMWLWEWEEGAAEALSTFRTAARLAEQFDDFVFNHNESLLYEWIEEFEPELFERIKKLIARGKWNVIGGWYMQPDCNLPCGEAFVRQIEEGNEYFKNKFGLSFETAVNFDSFGHSRGLVQIMNKAGYKNYLVCRPTRANLNVPDEFLWEGFDGSEIYTRRHFELYNSPLGKAAEKIRNLIEEHDDDPLCILWGVGNHGGGPSEKDLKDIAALQKEMLLKGVKIIHSTPDAYFKATKAKNKNPAKVDYSLRPSNTGCYTSQILVKHGYRRLENEYFSTEKMCAAATLAGRMSYPEKELSEARKDMLFVQFHDVLPGTAIKAAEETGLNMISHGLKILSELKLKAFFALSHGINYTACGNYPVLAFNPHPYETEVTVTCEFNLADQNWEDNFTVMDVFTEDGKELPSQIEKESSNLNLDWRKKVVFNAKLKPMQTALFECKPRKVDSVNRPALVGDYRFEDSFLATVNEKTGLVDISEKGADYIKNAFSLSVFSDTEDPWAMRDFQDKRLGDKLGDFTLLSEEESTEFSGVKFSLPPVRLIESGAVRDVVEAVYGYRDSKAMVRYTFYKNKNASDIFIRTYFYEKDKCLKLALPLAFGGELVGSQSYGEEKLRTDGGESVFGSWCGMRGEDRNLYVLNKGNYAASYENGTLYLTLLRTPAYTGHPINDREILFQDRYTERIDTGVRVFEFSLRFGKEDINAEREAALYSEKPFTLSFFPLYKGDKRESALVAEGGEVTAFYKRGDEYVVRVYNPKNAEAEASVCSEALGINEKVRLGAFEFKTITVKK